MPKYLLSAFFVFIFCANIFGQKVYFSTSINSAVYSIKKTTDKGFMIFGWIENGGNPFQNTITKIDKKGNVQWQKLIDGSFVSDNAYTTNNGNFIIHAINTRWFGVPTANDFNGGDILLNISQSGDTIWQTKPDSNQTYFANENNVCFESNGNIDLLTTDTMKNIFFEKFNNDGTRISKKLVPNLNCNYILNFIQTSPNSFVFNSLNLIINNIRNFTFTCIDSNGNILWTKKDTVFYYLMFIGNEIYGLNSVQDTVTLKLDLTCYKFEINGNLINKKQLIPSCYWQTGAFLNIGKSIKDGFYFFANYSTNDSVNSSRQFTYSQLFKVDENLNIKWSLTFNNIIQCIDTGNCNSIVCIFSDGNYSTYKTIVQSIKDPELDEVCDKCDNTVFPNPTTETFFNIKSNLPDVFIDNVEMFDYLGKSVWNSFNSINTNFFILNNNLSDGIYLCRIGCDNGKQQTKKVVIAK